MISLEFIQAQASCSSPEVDFEPFLFPEEGDNEKIAKAICRTCSVKRECLIFAITHGERHKIWGGLNEDERHQRRRELLRATTTN